MLERQGNLGTGTDRQQRLTFLRGPPFLDDNTSKNDKMSEWRTISKTHENFNSSMKRRE